MFASVGLVLTLLTGASFLSPPAEAQTVCVAHSDLVKELGRVHKERPVAVGLTSGGRLLEVFATEEGDTWTLVFTTPDGASCVISAGESWTEVPGKLVGDLS